MNPLQVLNQQQAAKAKRLQARRRRREIISICLFLAVSCSMIGMLQLKPITPKVELGEDTTLPVPTSTVSVAESPPEFQQKLTFKADMSFDEARAMFASNASSFAHQEGSANIKLASLPAIVVDESKANQKPAQAPSKLQPKIEQKKVAPTPLVNGKTWLQMNGDERYDYAEEYTKAHCRPLYDDPPWYPRAMVIPFLVAHNDENWLKAKITQKCREYLTAQRGG